MNRKPLIIAHRGASAVAPENTIRAFKTAIEVGADGIEFDVQLSRDGIAVIIHDDNLKRTGLLDSRVADLSAVELSEIDVGVWFARKNKIEDPTGHEGVPTLEQVFELYASTPGVLYLEMKCAVGQATDLAKVCCEMIANSGLKDRIIVESFDLQAIAEVKTLDGSIKTAALFEPKFSSPLGSRVIERATEVGANEVALHHLLATPRLVQQAKSTGFKVVVWTVDEPRWIARARAMEIDAIITNDPARMLAASPE